MNITYFCDNYKQHIIQLKTLLQNPEIHLLEIEIKELELADVEVDKKSICKTIAVILVTGKDKIERNFKIIASKTKTL